MAVTPTPTFTPIYKSVFMDEDRGSLAPAYLSYVPENGGTFSVNWDATFEDINFALYGILGAATITGGPAFLYTYNAPLTTAWSPQSYTIELGYDIGTAIAKGCLISKVSIKGNAKKNWTISASGFYQQHAPCNAVAIASSTNANPIEITTSTPHGLATGNGVVVADHLINTAANGTWTIIWVSTTKFTLTGSTGNGVGGATGTITQSITQGVADRTVEPILFAGETTLAIDAAGGVPGTTAVPSALVNFTLDIENQLQGFFTGDQKYPTDFAEDKLKVTLTTRLKWNAAVKALYANWIAGTAYVFQVKATSGSKYAALNFSGALSNDPQNYGIDYGAVTQELKFDAIYDSGSLANYLQVKVVNAIASLP
jgi:hypothetical protein